MNDLVISLDLLNVAAIIQGIQRVAQQLQALQNQMGQVSNPIQRVARSAQQATGPMQRLTQAAQNLKKALASGNQVQIFDAQVAYLRAQQHVQRASNFLNNPNGPGFGQRLMRALYSSRFGIGGGGGLSLMPLIGQVAGLFGKGSPWVAALLAAMTAVSAFASAVSAASQQVLAAFPGQFSLMTNATGASRVGAMGAALGMSPGQAAQLFHQLYESVSVMGGNYPGMGVAAKFGVQALGGPFDLNDQAAAIFKIIEGLKKEPFKQQQADLQRMGDLAQQVLSPLLNLPMEDIQTLANLQKQLYSPENVANAMKFNIIVQTIQQTFVYVALWLWDKMVKINNFLLGLPANKDPMKNWSDAAKDHANAMANHTAAMNKLSGVIGGGERAIGALPPALRGAALDHALRGQAINLGAFAV